MPKKFMNKSEFARYCGVTPPTVGKGVASKLISVTRSGFIDAEHPKNQEFMRRQKEWKDKTATGKSQAKPYAERYPEQRGRVAMELSEDEDDPPERSYTAGGTEAQADSMSEIDYAIEKMRSTTALNKARLAEMVRATIKRDMVDRVISLIGTSISDHLITLGDRLSPELAAMAGSTEASVIRRIKETLDADISAALGEMQRVVAEKYERQLEG